jgi:hypothetical protein
MRRWNSIDAPGRYPPVLAVEAFAARRFPTPFSAVFAGARFRAFTAFRALAAFPAFFDFALTVGFPFFTARTGLHFRIPRAFA